MKSFKLIASLLVAGVLLAACSLIPLGANALGYNGKEVQTTPMSAASTVTSLSFSPLASEGTATNTTAITFPDADTSSPIAPRVLSVVQGLRDELTITGPGALPDTITITSMSFTVRLSDAEGNVTISAESDESLTLTKTGSCAGTCTYRFDDASKAAEALSKQVTGDQLRQVISIVGSGGENSVDVTLNVVTESEPELAGTTLTLRLNVEEVTIRF